MSARFDDGKEDGALRTIGEVSKALGIKSHVLRYWEQQFPMLQPLKRSGGRRYYRVEDVALVETIDRLVNGEGYTLKGARKVIEEGGEQDSGQVQPDQTATQPEQEESAAVAADEQAPFDLPMDAALPEDGGVGQFFAEPVTEAGVEVEEVAVAAAQPLPSASPELTLSEDDAVDHLPRVEIVARLKAIRADLAIALAA